MLNTPAGQFIRKGSQAKGAHGRTECQGGGRQVQDNEAGRDAGQPGTDQDAAAGGEATQAEAARGTSASGADAGTLLLGSCTVATHFGRRLQDGQHAALDIHTDIYHHTICTYTLTI